MYNIAVVAVISIERFLNHGAGWYELNMTQLADMDSLRGCRNFISFNAKTSDEYLIVSGQHTVITY